MDIIRNKARKFIEDYGSVYFDDFKDPEKMKRFTKHLFDGEVTMRGLTLRKELFEAPNMPFRLRKGTIGEVYLMIPFYNIFSQAVNIKISNIDLRFDSKDISQISMVESQQFKDILKEVMGHFKQEYLSQLGNQFSIMDFSMLKNFVDRVIDNVQIEIKNVRIEIRHQVKKDMFTIFETEIKDLELFTTDSTFTTKQFVKQAKTAENGLKKQIFKVLSLTSFTVSVKFGEANPTYQKQKEAMERKEEWTIFRLSFQTRLIKNSEHLDQDPDYEAMIKFNENEMNMTQWQIQNIMSLLNYMSALNKHYTNLRSALPYKPSRKISEFVGKRAEQLFPEDVKAQHQFTYLRHICIANWWQWAIMEVVKSSNKVRKRQVKGKFYKVVSNMKIDRLFDFEVPSLMFEVYEADYEKYLEHMVQTNFNLNKHTDTALSMHNLKSLTRILPISVQKLICSRFAKKYAAKMKDAQKGGIFQWVMGYLFLKKDQGLSQDEKKLKNLFEGEFKSEEKSYSKFILKLDIDIKKGSYTLSGDTIDGKTVKFGFYTDTFSIQLQLYDGRLQSLIGLKSFSFVFSKSGQGNKKDIDIEVIRSTTMSKRDNFLNIKVDSITSKTKNVTNVEVGIQHVDIMFLNKIAKDLISYFKIGDLGDIQNSQALADLTRLSQQGSSSAKKVASSSSLNLTININMLSPRLIIPLCKDLPEPNTNLFIFYLGDMELNHSVKAGKINPTAIDLNMKIKHSKIEFWEDYINGMKHLHGKLNDELMIQEDRYQAAGSMLNKVILDIVASIKYKSSNDFRSHNINALVENIELNINPYTFHQLLSITKILDFNVELKKSELDQIRYAESLIDNSIWQGNVPVRFGDDSLYERHYVVITKTNLYVINTEESLKIAKDFPLAGFDMFICENNKMQIFTLKLFKGNKIIVLALSSFEEAYELSTLLMSEVQGIGINNNTDKSDQLPFVVNLDMTMRKVDVWLLNEIFDRSMLLCIKYLEVKMASAKDMKMRVSFDSLVIENFDETYKSRGISTICWVGSTHSPSKAEKKIIKKYLQGKVNTSAVSIEKTSQLSAMPAPPSLDPLEKPPSMNPKVVNPPTAIIKARAKKQQEDFNALDLEGMLLRQKLKAVDQGKREEDLTMKFREKMANWSLAGDQELGHEGLDRLDHPNLHFHEEYRNYAEDVEAKHINEMEDLKRVDEGFIFYMERINGVLDMDIHAVNITITFDTVFFNSFQKRITDFLSSEMLVSKTNKQPTGPRKKKKKIDPVAYDARSGNGKIQLRVNVKMDRLCLIGRNNNLNLFDIVMVDLKVIVAKYDLRTLINVYMKRLAIRDLTGYPFTKKPDQLKDYKKQTKNLLVSFVETSQDSNLEDLDNNGVIVLMESLSPEIVAEEKDILGSKMEVILKNGEVNFFLQPVLRFVDFALNQLLGYFFPDDSNQLTLNQVIERCSSIKKTGMNIFLHNLRINMFPNYYIDKTLVMEIPILIVRSERYLDPTRQAYRSQAEADTAQLEVFNEQRTRAYVPTFSENMSIQLKSVTIKGLARGVNAMEIREISVSFDRILYGGLLEKLLGPERSSL